MSCSAWAVHSLLSCPLEGDDWKETRMTWRKDPVALQAWRGGPQSWEAQGSETAASMFLDSGFFPKC